MELSIWPLFWRLSVESQVNLIQYQWNTYGLKLKIPGHPYAEEIELHFDGESEISLVDIDRFMRQPPSRQQRVN